MSSAKSLASDVREGRKTAVSVLEEHLKVIESRESEVHAFHLIARAKAVEAAAAID